MGLGGWGHDRRVGWGGLGCLASGDDCILVKIDVTSEYDYLICPQWFGAKTEGTLHKCMPTGQEALSRCVCPVTAALVLPASSATAPPPTNKQRQRREDEVARLSLVGQLMSSYTFFIYVKFWWCVQQLTIARLAAQ